MKTYFSVEVNKYDKTKHFSVVRPASLYNPKSNSVMFIIEKYIDRTSIFEEVDSCLIFWPITQNVPLALVKKHAIVRCEDPHKEYCKFYKDNCISHQPQYEKAEFCDGCWISKSAKIGMNTTIMPGCYIGNECIIGDNVYIGAGTKIVGEVIVGNNVVIRENSVIGADGLSTDRDIDGKAITMPQFGSVIIEDNVQIGANVVIARGAIDETRICKGSKIDNCTFISHNVKIGEDTFVVGESIMFGSSSAGKRCLISGNSTIMNAVHIGTDSIVGAGTVVTKSISNNSIVWGSPARAKEKRDE